MESSLVHQLQTEIGLLVRELKERDRELTSMVMSHQQQQACWNRDREGVLMLRDELARVEEKSMVTDKELRNVRGVLTECDTSLEEERRERIQLDRRVQEEQTRVREMRTELERTEEERDQLITSLRSAENRITELSSNENQMKNAIQQTLVGAELLEQELQDRLSCVEEVRVIRGENEQLREEVNSGRERILELTNQMERANREQESDRDVFNQSNNKLLSSVSTLERQLEVYRTAEERKSHLLSSYRTKQERLENEIRSLREMTTRHNSVSATQLRADFVSPQKPTRDVSPSSPAAQRLRDDPYPSSPVSPSPLRPCSLGIIRDEDETEAVLSQEVERVSASLERKIDTILHSIDTTQSPWQQRSLSAIPEDMELKLSLRDSLFD